MRNSSPEYIDEIEPNEYYRMVEIAPLFMVTYRTILNWTKYCGLKSIKPRKHRLIRGKDLIFFIRQNMKNGEK